MPGDMGTPGLQVGPPTPPLEEELPLEEEPLPELDDTGPASSPASASDVWCDTAFVRRGLHPTSVGPNATRVVKAHHARAYVMFFRQLPELRPTHLRSFPVVASSMRAPYEKQRVTHLVIVARSGGASIGRPCRPTKHPAYTVHPIRAVALPTVSWSAGIDAMWRTYSCGEPQRLIHQTPL
jgi:hypothetical protein